MMFENIYIVTVYHHSKEELIQFIIDGDFERAHRLRDYIICCSFESKLDQITSTIIEITGTELRIFIGCSANCITYRMNLRNNFYIFQIYEGYCEETGTYSIQVDYCNDWGAKNKDALEKIRSDEEISQLPCVVNKISKQGIYYIEKDGNQTKVKFVRISQYCYGEVITIEEDIIEAQPKKPWYDNIPVHLHAFPDRKAISRHPHI